MEALPELPVFNKEQIYSCRESGDPRPLLFEWFKAVAGLAFSVASISPTTAGYRSHPKVHAAIVTGLANRCSRLMLSIGKLSCGGQGGESSSILVRCVVETAITLRWLTESPDPDEVFHRYVVDGLRPDLVLEDHINQCIMNRGGDITVIEKRMLASIDRSRKDAGLDRPDVEESKGMPGLKSIMTEELDMDDAQYIAIQRMLSQFVHGRWNDLRAHYIAKDATGNFRLRDVDEAPVHSNLLMLAVVTVSDALLSAFQFMVEDEELEKKFGDYYVRIRNEANAADNIRSHGDNDIAKNENT